MNEKLTPSNRDEKIGELANIAAFNRTKALETIITAENGHIGGSLSSVELLTALYFGGQFNFDPDNSKNKNRDRVLIRGHEGPLRYTIFSLLGYIEPEELNTYRSLGSRLQGHEDMFETPGVDITPSGSLGMLLSYGVGSAIANKDKGLDSRTIVFLGDGEEQEGNVSEAARHGASLGLDNLICIIDKNKKQLSRPTDYSDGKSNLKKIWDGYGWNVLEIKDGHDLSEILDTYDSLQNISSPTVVIANTIKGYGVDGAAEHFNGYHTLSAVPDKKTAVDSLKRLQSNLDDMGLTHEKISRAALSLVSRPLKTEQQREEVGGDLYDIKSTKSGLNLEIAQENYMLELKNRIIDKASPTDFYFVTPDLMRTDVVEKAGIKDYTHFIDTGIREQHAIAMSHGISVENPDARIYVCYGDAFAYRALDQMNAAATSGSNMMIVGENAGIFQGQNGKTHQSVGQPGALMGIPELKFYEPADAVDLHNVFSHVLTENDGVNYVRFHRGAVTIERNEGDMNNIDGYFIHQPDKEAKLVLMSSGFMAESAVTAAKNMEVEHGIPTSVVNIVNQKNLENYLPELVTNNAPIVTVYNGAPKILSSSVAEAILGNQDIPRPAFIAGHGYESGTTGKVDDLIRYFRFDAAGITNFSLESLKKWKKT